MFLENYSFKYPWRKYQANVLAELETHMHDDKLNIVAAPGSGKTILGLEIVRRLNKNVLILSPTLTIKNQWVDRFLTLFVQEQPIPDFISSDIYDLNRFNVATYQGLHFAHRRKKIEEQLEAEEEEETRVNVRGVDIAYDLIAELKAKQIEVIVLDEAHHLRSAWWKSLTEVLNALPKVKTIALTATPPYDVDKSEWDKYASICGPVDCEISVPELVATKDLCPHQDFIVFSKLSPQEEKIALDIQGAFDRFADGLKANRAFIRALAALPELNDHRRHEEKILENPQYYSSLLVFLQAVGERVDKGTARALGGGAKKIPPLDIQWLEILLQGVLFDDAASFAAHGAAIEEVRAELSKAGGIEKKRVMLQSNHALKKLLAGSVSKMDSIVEIARRESACLKEDLSMAILVDYIRREALEQEQYNKIGVVPIFKRLAQANIQASVAILTGSLKVIPLSLVPFVEERLPECVFEDIGLEGYVSIGIREAYKSRLVSTITAAVVEKKLNIVVGTVALLGEGWDCPAINSLVLASFVGSFMLSNQMRGRAIRSSKQDPAKVSNIWHLVGITRHSYQKIRLSSALDFSDYDTLKRRFQGFVGIAYRENLIQNGLERLDIIDAETLQEEYEHINEQMFALARNRTDTKRRWKEILALFGGEDIKIVNTLQGRAEKETRFRTFAFYDLQNMFLGLVVVLAFSIWGIIELPYVDMDLVWAALLALWQLYWVSKLVGHLNPVKNMQRVGDAMLGALQQLGAIQTSRGLVVNRTERIRPTRGSGQKTDIYRTKLHGATVYENNLYIQCVGELYQRVDNPRYVIQVRNRLRTSYFNVPTLFAGNKANAEIMLAHWKKHVGKGALVYTRSAKGRKTLLAARKGSFDYNEKFYERKRAMRKDDWK